MNIYRSWHMFKEWIATIWKYSKWTLIPCTYIASQWICCYITTHYDLWRFQSLVGPVSLGVIDQFDIRTFSCNSTAGRGYAALFVCFNSRWFDAHGCNIGLWLGLQGSTSSTIWHPRNTTDWQIFILKSTKQIGLGKCMMWETDNDILVPSVWPGCLFYKVIPLTIRRESYGGLTPPYNPF